MFKYLCECNSTCVLTVEISNEEYDKIDGSVYLISNSCSHGPEADDKLVKKTDKYSLYKSYD